MNKGILSLLSALKSEKRKDDIMNSVKKVGNSSELNFLTDVNDLGRKNKLVEDLIYGNLNVLTIVAAVDTSEPSTLKDIYEDREAMELSEFSKDFDIEEQMTYNPDGKHYATLTFKKKNNKK